MSICKDCQSSCTLGNFRKIVNLKNSGIAIYEYFDRPNKCGIVPKKSNSILFHNQSGKEVKRFDYVRELSQYKTKCYHCVSIIKRIRNLIDEITDLRENEILSICDHCKKSRKVSKCKRCEYILSTFRAANLTQFLEHQHRLDMWMCKTKRLIDSFDEQPICKHITRDRRGSIDELEHLLQDLRDSTPICEPEINLFPDTPLPKMPSGINDFSQTTQKGDQAVQDDFPASQSFLDEMLIKLKKESTRRRMSSDDSLYASPSKDDSNCVCKYLKEKLELPSFLDNVPKETPVTREEEKEKEMISLPVRKKEKAKVKVVEIKKHTSKETLITSALSHDKKNKSEKHKLSPDSEMFLKMIKDRNRRRTQNEKPIKEEKPLVVPKIDTLPEIVKKPTKVLPELRSDSVIECIRGVKNFCQKMVKGTDIVPFDPHYTTADESSEALLYKVKTILPLVTNSVNGTTAPLMSSITNESKKKSNCIQEDGPPRGLIKYMLSDRQFIDKGWTKLPTSKVMRRLNVYKMIPARAEYDWFTKHKDVKRLNYDTGQILANINDDGTGQWYYRSGDVALEYHYAAEANAQHRYVVYSAQEQYVLEPIKSKTILGTFDYLGNGVVYDEHGNERLKYNQTEGVVIDPKIGSPGKWKWHSLNEPTVLQPVYHDTFLKQTPDCPRKQLEKISEETKKNPVNEEMLAIEFENFVKEMKQKLSQKFKPFQIRMKALKLNKYFSLRVIDQSNVYLIFRDGRANLKLNLGMILLSNEIVDTDMSEFGTIATSYDKIPARSNSLEQIQETLTNVRGVAKRTIKDKSLVSSVN